jgi:ubiquinone/menaquinone biosynthesis C-methylase UbiE
MGIIMMDEQIIEIFDYNEILSLAWNELEIRSGQKALDIGIGTKALSASGMLGQKLKVVGIDTDPECLTHSEKLGIPIHICDASSLPFEEGHFDISIAFFTLHEVDPKNHLSVISEMKRVSKKIVLVDPLPNNDEIGKIYDKIWHEAMDSVGRFEIYQSMDYWVNLVSSYTPKKIRVFRLRLTKKADEKNSVSFCNQSIQHFEKYGIDRKYMNRIEKLAEKIKIHGMEPLDMIMIIAFFN